MSAQDQMRAMLDQLMGTARDGEIFWLWGKQVLLGVTKYRIVNNSKIIASLTHVLYLES